MDNPLRNPTIVRTPAEIQEVLSKAGEAIAEGTTHWRSETFEAGVDAAIRWLIGDSDDNPMED